MNDTRRANGAFDVIRKIPLADAATEPLKDTVRQLCDMDAVSDARVDKLGRLRVAYDASRIGLREIEALLDASGVARDTGFWPKLRLAWYRFLDDNAKANARTGEGACCNRPPPVPPGRARHHD